MLNSVVIMGRLTKIPELRTTGTGTSVTSFTLAVDRDRGEKQTDFIDCVAWKHTAEFVSKYFTKGQMMVVAGRLESRKWTDKNDNSRTAWEVVADNVYFGEAKRVDIGTADPKPVFAEISDEDGELLF